MGSTQEAGCQLQRRNSSKKGRKHRKKWTAPSTGVNQEAIKKALKDLEAEKKANSTGVEEGPVIACTIDGSVNPAAMCIESETRLDCRMDSPTAQERARVKRSTLGRGGKQGRTSTNSEFSMDGITAQEMKSFTLGRIKQTESIKNSESSCSLPSRAQPCLIVVRMHALVLSCCILPMFVIACVECSHSHHTYTSSLTSCSSSVILSTYV